LIHGFATLPHYRAHIEPIIEAFGDRGGTITSHPLRLPEGEPVILASHRDLKKIRDRPVFHVEHGAGQTYLGDGRRAHPAYSGGDSKHLSRVSGFVVPNHAAAQRWKDRFPDTPVEAVGCCKLDRLHSYPVAPDPHLLVWTFHWDGRSVSPEAGTAWFDYKPHLPRLVADLRARGWTVVAHAHPHWKGALWPTWEALGVEWTTDAEWVLTHAEMLVGDNTSLLYEFASLDKPVVCLNASTYRRDVHHGLRFWDAVPGLEVDDPEDLGDTVRRANVLHQIYRPEWREAVSKAYSWCDGRASARAVAFIDEVLGVERATIDA
jgi:hypothetical protein